MSMAGFQESLSSIDEYAQVVAAKLQEAKEALNKLEVEIGLALGCADLEQQAIEGKGKMMNSGEDGDEGNIR